MIAVMVVTSRK